MHTGAQEVTLPSHRWRWLLQPMLEHYHPLLQYMSGMRSVMDQTLATKHTLTKYWLVPAIL